MKVLVITPTIGHEKLGEAIKSVAAQESPYQIDHLLVIDGPQYEDKVKQQAEGIMTITLPFNVGANGFYGHRIYAAMAHLIPHEYEYVFFLDDDNWFAPNHVATCIEKLIETGSEFTYALRSFYTYDGKFFADDNCASLGKWKIWDDGGHHLIDTNAYCFKRKFIETYGYLWHNRYAADRTFYNLVSPNVPHECTNQRTVAYRLAPSKDDKYEGDLKFIIENNALAARKYPDGYPWELK